MGLLEGFWIRNYKSMRQVGIGTGFPQFVYIDDETNVLPYPLDAVTVFAGASGSGKSTIFDAFSFVSDCYHHGIDFACLKRGGYDAIYSQGGKGALSFGFHLRRREDKRAATYAVSIGCAKNKAPFIESELLAYRHGKESTPIFFLQNGVKSIRYLAPHEHLGTVDLTKIEFTDYKHLGLAALEVHPGFPVLASFRHLFETWVLSDFTPDPARGLDLSLPKRQESPRGVNLFGVVRYILHQYGNKVDSILQRAASILPNVDRIEIDHSVEDKPLVLFHTTGASEPIPITLLSEATIRLFTYALLLEEDVPAPMIALEEPENGLDRLHCWKLSEVIKQFDSLQAKDVNSQLFLSTHHPGFADVLDPAQVWVLERDREGFTIVERAADSIPIEQMLTARDTLGPRWFGDRFEQNL